MKPTADFAFMVIDMFKAFNDVVKDRDHWTEIKKPKLYYRYAEFCQKWGLEYEPGVVFVEYRRSPIELYTHLARLWLATNQPQWRQEAEDLTVFNPKVDRAGRTITFWCPHGRLLEPIIKAVMETGHSCLINPHEYSGNHNHRSL